MRSDFLGMRPRVPHRRAPLKELILKIPHHGRPLSPLVDQYYTSARVCIKIGFKKNDRNIFEIPSLLSLQRGNPEQDNSK